MKKFLSKLKSIIPSRRRLIQLYAALLFNANIKGFVNGQIYKGPLKNICTPGLNCYSCPGASGACPLGALQNSLASSDKRAPYFVVGIIMLYGILLGRLICGFLCPFGLIQDLLYKIKTPKLKKNRFTKILSYFKYVILVLFVVVFPLAYMFKDFPLPAFCKYICPAGTLEGAVGLLSNAINESKLSMLGPLFTWKFVLMVSFIVGAVFIYRIFCRFVCPLGALYGLFNRFAICGIKLEKPKCIDCGKCINKCKMDISQVGDHECINCGECIPVCPTKAIQWRGSKILLPENEICEDMTVEEKTAITAKRKKRILITRIIAGITMIAVLVAALLHFNVFDKVPEKSEGSEIGELCYSYDLTYIEGRGEGTVNIEDYRGKVVVINFWGTWCTPCVAELPHFNDIANEYSDEIVVLAIHTSFDSEDASEFVESYYSDSNLVFVYDDNLDDYSDAYYTDLGGSGAYPMTLVLNSNGVITEKVEGAMTHDELLSAVESALKQVD